MLKQISTSEFLGVMTLLTGLYYATILALYYRTEIRDLLKKKEHLLKNKDP